MNHQYFSLFFSFYLDHQHNDQLVLITVEYAVRASHTKNLIFLHGDAGEVSVKARSIGSNELHDKEWFINTNSDD